MERTIEVGQVWRRKGYSERLCVGAINRETRKVWMNGLPDMVDPIFDWQYLDDNYELEEHWSL